MKLLCLYLVNLIPISLALAIFEIWLEGFKKGPWGRTEFDHPFWGKKITGKGMFLRFLIGKVLEKTYITPYHVIMFVLLIPLVTIVNYGILWYLSDQTWSIHALLVMPIAGTKIIAPIFILAIWLGNMILEDFLWFTLQTLTGWRERQALPWLLAGNFPWHTKWWGFWGIKLPRFYITTPPIIATILLLQYWIALKFN